MIQKECSVTIISQYSISWETSKIESYMFVLQIMKTYGWTIINSQKYHRIEYFLETQYSESSSQFYTGLDNFQPSMFKNTRCGSICYVLLKQKVTVILLSRCIINSFKDGSFMIFSSHLETILIAFGYRNIHLAINPKTNKWC